MRTYEELFFLKPAASEEEIDQLIEQTKQVITAGGGVVDKVDKWGLRRLAYPVQKCTEGYYILVEFTCGPEVVKEIERRFRVADLVMKFLTVRVDVRRKKIEKRRKQREKRAKRRPAPMSAAPSVPIAPGAPVAAPSAPGRPAAAEQTAEPAAENAGKE